MIDGDLDTLISALMNNTRREILRRLILEESYALEISRSVGISQQAINKQLDLLERANLISAVGMIPSSEGARRKVYRPTNFSTLVTDYSRNFIEVKRYEIRFENSDDSSTENAEPSKLIHDLEKVNSDLEKLMKERVSLLKKKDGIIGALHNHISNLEAGSLEKNILWEYVDSADPEGTARKFNVTPSYVMGVVETYLH
jgi:predicted transcriptional regulator